MRLPRRHARVTGDAQEAVSSAIAAGTEASKRLADASETRAQASEQAAHEQRTIIKDLREMRRRNHLADLIAASIEKRHPQ